MEQMHYPNGKPKQSIWKQKEKYLNINKLLMLSKCNTSNIIHHENWKNVYVEGYNIGLKGEKLERIYFDKIRRNLVISLVFENCFKYFGDNNCNLNNMHNVYMILSDTDEIPRHNVLKLLKRCDSKIIQKPGLMVTIEWQAYDFGCHLGKSENRQIKIISLKYMSPDRQQKSIEYRGSPGAFQRKYDIENITVIDNGGWHLTYFGNSTEIVRKNKHKAHLFFRRGNWIDPIYQQCQYEICSYYVHGKNSYRVVFVDKNDEYYPLIVTSNLSHNHLSQISHSLKNAIDVEPSLYKKWLIYWNNITKHDVDSQKSYCRNMSLKLAKK